MCDKATIWQWDTKEKRAIIDYIKMKQNWKSIVQDIRIFRGVECGFEQQMVKILTENFNSTTVNREETRFKLTGIYSDSTKDLHQRNQMNNEIIIVSMN